MTLLSIKINFNFNTLVWREKKNSVCYLSTRPSINYAFLFKYWLSERDRIQISRTENFPVSIWLWRYANDAYTNKHTYGWLTSVRLDLYSFPFVWTSFVFRNYMWKKNHIWHVLSSQLVLGNSSQDKEISILLIDNNGLRTNNVATRVVPRKCLNAEKDMKNFKCLYEWVYFSTNIQKSVWKYKTLGAKFNNLL